MSRSTARAEELVAFVERRRAGEVGRADGHREVDGGAKQTSVPGRHRPPHVHLVVARDPEVLAATVPHCQVQDCGRDQVRALGEHQPVGGSGDGDGNRDHLERHVLPQPASYNRVVGGAKMKLGQQEISGL
jgi:hypothetical protein